MVCAWPATSRENPLLRLTNYMDEVLKSNKIFKEFRNNPNLMALEIIRLRDTVENLSFEYYQLAH